MRYWSTINVVDEFLISRGMLRPNSIRDYRNDLLSFAQAFPELPLTFQPIQKWLNEQKRINGDAPLTPETLHHRFRSIRAMYRQFWDWHEVKLRGVPNPINKVRVPQPRPKAMRIWSEQELYNLFTSEMSSRDRALINLFLDLGPRASECCSLTWDDVLPDSFIILRGKTGERVEPISESTFRLILALKPAVYTGKDQVFIGMKGPLTYWGIYSVVRRLCARAGISGKRASPHTFRHTFGTYYADSEYCQPKILQALLGHSDFKTTQRYINNSRKQIARNHALCTPLHVIAAAAQSNFLDKIDAVKAAETIIHESVAAFVSRKVPRSAGG